MPCCIDRMRFSLRFTIRRDKASNAFSFLFLFFQARGSVRGARFFLLEFLDFAIFFVEKCGNLIWNPWAGFRVPLRQVRRCNELQAIKIFESNLGNQPWTRDDILDWWRRRIKAAHCPRPLYIKKKRKILIDFFFWLGGVLSGSPHRSFGHPGVAQR